MLVVFVISVFTFSGLYVLKIICGWRNYSHKKHDRTFGLALVNNGTKASLLLKVFMADIVIHITVPCKMATVDTTLLSVLP